MALMRSGQKGLDEIQRIRLAMEGGNPIHFNGSNGTAYTRASKVQNNDNDDVDDEVRTTIPS
jgi:hypothetical protein